MHWACINETEEERVCLRDFGRDAGHCIHVDAAAHAARNFSCVAVSRTSATSNQLQLRSREMRDTTDVEFYVYRPSWQCVGGSVIDGCG